MSAAVLGKVFDLRKIPPHVKLLLLVMANNAQEDGFCHVSKTHLRERTGLSEIALKASLLEAERLKLLLLDPQPGKGMILAWRIGREE